MTLAHWREVVIADFEFSQPPSQTPKPVCLVARELRSGRRHHLMLDCNPPTVPPYPVDGGSLFVAYAATAEASCHLALGWPMPVNVLDLFAEFRRSTAGLVPIDKTGLLAALEWFHLPAMTAETKDANRQLAIEWFGCPRTDNEQNAILTYCGADVDATIALLRAMEPGMALVPETQALFRGQYSCAVAAMEAAGIPLDADLLGRLSQHWADVLAAVVRAKDEYGLYDGTHFRLDRFAELLRRGGAYEAWTKTAQGKPSTDEAAREEMAGLYPWFQAVDALLGLTRKMNAIGLQAGPDGRSRVSLCPYAAKTGRNQPRKAGKDHGGFVFGKPAWARSLIRPTQGMALAYCDWSQQENAIAGVLSGDQKLLAGYTGGDPYLAFAIAAGAAPPTATKASHPAVRALYKTASLAINYGMTAFGLARRIGKSEEVAEGLLADHHRVYRTYWNWQDRGWSGFLAGEPRRTPLGWELRFGVDADNKRTVMNWPMQAAGADMMRCAVWLCWRRGIHVLTPVHDALLVEAPLGEIDAVAAATEQAMADASAVVLKGFRCRTDSHIVRGGHVGGYRPTPKGEAWACQTCDDPRCLGGNYHDERDDGPRIFEAIMTALLAAESQCP